MVANKVIEPIIISNIFNISIIPSPGISERVRLVWRRQKLAQRCRYAKRVSLILWLKYPMM